MIGVGVTKHDVFWPSQCFPVRNMYTCTGMKSRRRRKSRMTVRSMPHRICRTRIFGKGVAPSPSGGGSIAASTQQWSKGLGLGPKLLMEYIYIYVQGAEDDKLSTGTCLYTMTQNSPGYNLEESLKAPQDQQIQSSGGPVLHGSVLLSKIPL